MSREVARARRPQRSGRAAIDVDSVALPAFGLSDEHAPGEAAPHAHAKHQLLYAERGTLELTADGARWLLPPERAAWIGAGVEHSVKWLSAVSLRTVYFARGAALVPGARCAVFTAVPLAREMIAWAMHWGPERASEGRAESAFFAALAALAGTWAESPLPFSLPVARSQELARALEHVLARLGEDVDVAQTARAAGVSERTLARRFQDETGMGFRAFVGKARMLRAMALLAAPGARVTDVALAVGFESPAAFTRAFEAFAGERPKDYRRSGRG